MFMEMEIRTHQSLLVSDVKKTLDLYQMKSSSYVFFIGISPFLFKHLKFVLLQFPWATIGSAVSFLCDRNSQCCQCLSFAVSRMTTLVRPQQIQPMTPTPGTIVHSHLLRRTVYDPVPATTVPFATKIFSTAPVSTCLGRRWRYAAILLHPTDDRTTRAIWGKPCNAMSMIAQIRP